MHNRYDAEWLLAVGFAVDGPRAEISGPLTTLCLWLSDSACWAEETNRRGPKVAVSKPQTRDELRSLCAALHIPLKG